MKQAVIDLLCLAIGISDSCGLKNSVFKRGGFDIAVMSQLCCRFVKCGPETVRHRVKPL